MDKDPNIFEYKLISVYIFQCCIWTIWIMFLLPIPNYKKGKKNIIGKFSWLYLMFLPETIFNTIERHSSGMVHVNRFSSFVVVSNRANLKNHLIQKCLYCNSASSRFSSFVCCLFKIGLIYHLRSLKLDLLRDNSIKPNKLHWTRWR